MSKLFIHIGMGKTGTTGIQQTLRKRHGRQPESALSYPIFSAEPSHNELLVLLKPHASLPRTILSHFPKDDERFRTFVARVRQTLVEHINRGGNLVISSEYFWDLADRYVQKLTEVLQLHRFNEVGVIAYLREPVSYYQSFIQQRLKASTRFPQPHEFTVNYVDTLNRWQEQLGEQIRTRIYAPDKLLDGSTTNDFLNECAQFFALEPARVIANETDAQSQSRRQNESLTAAGLLCLYEVRRTYFSDSENRYTQDSKQLLKLVREGQRQLKLQTKPLIKPEHQQTILAASATELKRLKKQFGIDFLPTDAGPRALSHTTPINELSDLLATPGEVLDEKNRLDKFISANRFW